MTRLCICVGMLLILMSGCVTQSTGGLPDPADAPERVRAQLDLARGYLESGNMERARVALNKALEIDSRAVEAHVLLGVLNAAESEWGLAERDFERALAIEPKNSQALNNYGSFLYSRERYPEAVRVLSELVKDTDYRARSQAYENLGLALLRTGDVEAAKEAFNRSLQLSFDHPQSNLELAEIAYNEGDLNTARGYFDSFRERARQTPRSLCLGMKLSQSQGDMDGVASYAMALNNLYPDAPETSECTVP